MEEVFERLDVLLLKKNIFISRERAKENIIKGNILVDGVKITKCGKKISQQSSIVFVGEAVKYVSRGGLKLEKAISFFNINLDNKICLDVGASTGGFTDCMLQYGAKKVFALDVGYNQLSQKLRNNDKVISYEHTNVKQLTENFFEDNIDFVTVDVSFISLLKVLPYIDLLLKDNSTMVALIKPQYEAGKKYLNKQGVVKNKKIHLEIVKNIIKHCNILQLKVMGFDYSPIKGPNGNIEYLIYLSKGNIIDVCTAEDVVEKINDAFSEL